MTIFGSGECTSTHTLLRGAILQVSLHDCVTSLFFPFAVLLLCAGFIARDPSQGMGVENSTYVNHEMEYVLQRYDQVGRAMVPEVQCLL